MRDDFLNIQIDRHVVAKLHHVGEAERRDVVTIGGQIASGVGKQRQFGIRRRQKHHVARGLPEIDGFLSVGNGARLCG